jgi:hypothetical protein
MIERHITPALLDALGDRPAVFLQGARQVGKSTLVQQLASAAHPARYLTLDDAEVLGAARADPSGFIAGLGERVVIDEVQLVPELFRAIKAAIDRDRRPGRFLLTGSANVLLVPRVSESLAGRMEILTLWPLSQGEIEGRRETFIDAVFGSSLPQLARQRDSRQTLLERAFRGGYPEVQRLATHRRRAWFASYITTILQRDIRELANIEGRTELPRLLSLLAARASSLANVAELSRSIGIAYNTLKRYLALLETTFLFHVRPAWAANLGKRLVRAPKLALVDSGLLANLLGLSIERLGHDTRALGPLLENFVAMELEKQRAWSRVQPQLFHFRTQSGSEVDIVLEAADGLIVGIEVKAGASFGAGDLAGLRSLRELAGKRFRRGVLLHTGHESVSLGDQLVALPVGALWQPAS